MAFYKKARTILSYCDTFLMSINALKMVTFETIEKTVHIAVSMSKL